MNFRFDLHAQRYGEIISADLEGTNYTESQCGECPHDHRCCDLIVTASPAEAAGILDWVQKNAPDVIGMARLIEFRAATLLEHFKKFGADKKAAIAAWFQKRIKCVFYDSKTKRCGIYPVRPIACRRAYGDGDCDNSTGIRMLPDSSEVLTARVARFKIHADLAQNLGEMTTMLSKLAMTQDLQVQVDADFYSKDPSTLTEDQVIFGLMGIPIKNPVALETNDGRSIRPKRTGTESRS